ncbi:MAG: hypothetical protein MUC62_06615 [Candidatus Thermoplasmatota archaeon]|jgi:predicted RNA binding protein with dsRBD fold (UPF0201 family)|nr:hypothetical protein [Candidatus Thermoplasmatota archaeon]
MKVLIRTDIHPTEDPEKVKASVLNIFPRAKLSIDGSLIEGTTDDLERFIELLKDLRIRDTAVSILKRPLSGDRTAFHLHKQVAFASKVNFTEGTSSLGDITVEVMSGASELIERVTPPQDSTVQHHLNTHPSHEGEDELESL